MSGAVMSDRQFTRLLVGLGARSFLVLLVVMLARFAFRPLPELDGFFRQGDKGI
jgi:hypothetical protein